MEDAKNYCYPSAFTFVARTASKQTLEDRRVTKAIFAANVRPAQALYTKWFMQTLGKRDYYKEIRAKYFSAINVERKSRVFSLETTSSDSLAILISVLLQIRKKMEQPLK